MLLYESCKQLRYTNRSVQRGVQRGAFSPTSGATPATPTLGATPKLLSATPKDFVPSEKAKRITISGAANMYFSKDLKKKIF